MEYKGTFQSPSTSMSQVVRAGQAGPGRVSGKKLEFVDCEAGKFIYCLALISDRKFSITQISCSCSEVENAICCPSG
jgi:hypothetical protein